jgi:hypothetical protein
MPKMIVNICEVHTVPIEVEVENALNFTEIREKAEKAYLEKTTEGSEINLEYSHTLPKEQWHIAGVVS